LWRDDAYGAVTCWWCPWSLWLCLLLLPPVCFLSHYDSLCCVPSDRLQQQRMDRNHPGSILQSTVILSTSSIPSNLLWSWVVTNPRFFWLWHNLIGYCLVVMLLGSSQRSSLVRQLVIPPIFQPVHLVHNLLTAFRPLFRMKFFSFLSRLLSFHVPLQHTPVLSGTIIIPRVLTGRRAKGVMQKILFGSVLCS